MQKTSNMKKGEKKVQRFTEEQIISIGLSNLNLNSTLYDMMLEQFQKKHQEILCSKEWKLQVEFQKSQLRKLLICMKSTKVEEIDFSGGKITQKMFVQICPIQFQNLQYLFLYENLISNIQFLVFLDAPSLSSITLCENKISQISKTIGKMSLKNLINFNISVNFVKQVDFGRMESLREEGFFVQFDDNLQLEGFSYCSIEDKSNYAKTKNMNASSLYCFSHNFAHKIDYLLRTNQKADQILQPRCLNALMRKVNEKQINFKQGQSI